IFTPPNFTNSALTPDTLRPLIRSTTAGGKVFSIPKMIPIFLSMTELLVLAVTHRDLRTENYPLITRSTSPPSSATKANRGRCDRPTHPANGECPWYRECATSSHSHPCTSRTH